MADAELPHIVAGYSQPVCPTCDKPFGPEVADAGPVQCEDCGKWFETTAVTVYQAEPLLDYKGEKPPTAKQPARKKSAAKKPASRTRHTNPKR